MAATLLWQRDLASDASQVKTTLTSWDGCMSKTWCKWPVIIGIVIGGLIIFSIVACLVRCLCCGVECCCGCLSCFNACCPSPRRKRNRDGYQEQAPYFDPRRPPPFQQQYQSSPAPVYGSNAPYPRNVPAKTATFVTSHTGADMSGGNGSKFNEDALPAMPSWNNAVSRRVEQEPEEEMEMDKLNPREAQQQSLIPQRDPYYGYEKEQQFGDLDVPSPTSPHDYNPHMQNAQQPPRFDTGSHAGLPDYHSTPAPIALRNPSEPYSQPPSYGSRAPLSPMHPSPGFGPYADQPYASSPYGQQAPPAQSQWNAVHAPPQQYSAYSQTTKHDYHSTSQTLAMPDGPMSNPHNGPSPNHPSWNAI